MFAPPSLVNEIDYQIPKLRLCLVNDQSHCDVRICIHGPEDVVRILHPLKVASEEHFVSVHLNSKNEVLGLHEVSHGTLSTSLVHPREVFKAALLANSFAILVCHNHPSGASISASKDDYLTTKQLIRAGGLLGVSLVDHIIIGPSSSRTGSFFSFRDNHPDLWHGKDARPNASGPPFDQLTSLVELPDNFDNL